MLNIFRAYSFTCIKVLEYRSTPINVRDHLYVYAGLQQGGTTTQLKQTGKTFEQLPKGAIVGSVEITDCIYDEKNACYAYKLANPKRLRKFLKPINQPSPRFWRPKFI